MKVLKRVKLKGKRGKCEKIIHRCPVCGKEMEETYLGRDYCYECEKKYFPEDGKQS